MIANVFLLGLFGLLAAFFNDLDVVVENGCNDRNHVSLNDSSTHTFRTTDPYVDNALESEIPLPHIHHILTPSLLQYAHEPLDTAIDGEDVSDSSRGSGKVCEMVERVDER